MGLLHERPELWRKTRTLKSVVLIRRVELSFVVLRDGRLSFLFYVLHAIWR
jgi:hypothetical protein